MYRRIVLAAVLVVLATPVWAQSGPSRQTVSFNFGGFRPVGVHGRVDGDVLVENVNFLTFGLEDFRNVTIGADLLIAVGDFIEVGVGANYYARSVPTVYRNWVDIDDTEIPVDLRLRIVPLTATGRFLPLGSNAPVQPYVGAGVAVLFWRYSEVGEFFDENFTIFPDRFIASGTNVGPVILGGVRAPLGERVMIGGEIRWQKGEGTLGVEGFLDDRIDLGGFTYQFTLGVRF